MREVRFGVMDGCVEMMTVDLINLSSGERSYIILKKYNINL
jgi:hypothetical protein